MERLTERERNVDGTGAAKEEITDGLLKPFADKILTKLADYEDLEEQGLLVRLPCKVGNTVYVKSSACYKSKYIEAQVRDYAYFISCGFCVVVTSAEFGKLAIPFSEFGKTVFLTREEAEKKLEEMKENG